MSLLKSIRVIDSHTGGEPTRVVVDGGPDLGRGSVAERLARFRSDFDSFRSAVVNEPRGSDVLVGALLVPASTNHANSGIIFFNNVGFLGMCGHGTMGVVATLAYLGRLPPGSHQFETSVGLISAQLHEDYRVTVRNVPSFRKHQDIEVELSGLGKFSGDIAWGGNWFYLVKNHGIALELSRLPALLEISNRLKSAVHRKGFPEVDHVELVGPPKDPANHGRNFVLCPGGAYDRSPCGTGTSAKLACLAADGHLAPGEVWRQESVIGSVFEASYEPSVDGAITPLITGRAWITGDNQLLMDPSDPFVCGIPSAL